MPQYVYYINLNSSAKGIVTQYQYVIALRQIKSL